MSGDDHREVHYYGMGRLLDVRVDPEAVRGRRIAHLEFNLSGGRFNLKGIDFDPPCTGPEAELTYLVPEQYNGDPEPAVRAELGQRCVPVYAVRTRDA